MDISLIQRKAVSLYAGGQILQLPLWPCKPSPAGQKGDSSIIRNINIFSAFPDRVYAFMVQIYLRHKPSLLPAVGVGWDIMISTRTHFSEANYTERLIQFRTYAPVRMCKIQCASKCSLLSGKKIIKNRLITFNSCEVYKAFSSVLTVLIQMGSKCNP